MLMNPLGNRLSRRQATRRVTQHCDQVLAPLDLRATQLSMLREIGRLGPIALDPLAEAMVMDRARARGSTILEVILDICRSSYLSISRFNSETPHA
jgi:hypothetical protein